MTTEKRVSGEERTTCAKRLILLLAVIMLGIIAGGCATYDESGQGSHQHQPGMKGCH